MYNVYLFIGHNFQYKSHFALPFVEFPVLKYLTNFNISVCFRILVNDNRVFCFKYDTFCKYSDLNAAVHR